MFDPLPRWLQIYSKVMSVGSDVWHTFFIRLKYWPFLTIGPNCKLQGNLTIRQFYTRNSRLRIVMKGYNRIGHHSHIQGSGTISFGLRSYCGAFCVFGVNDHIEIGKDVIIADAVTIRDTDHVFRSRASAIMSQGMNIRPVAIQDDVWLGHGVTILKGVTIGRGSIVAAGAVVTKDVPPFSIVGGIPARLIRTRESV